MTKMPQQGLVSTQLSRFPEMKRENNYHLLVRKEKQICHYVFCQYE